MGAVGEAVARRTKSNRLVTVLELCLKEALVSSELGYN